jgi:hypothetical protein
MVEPLPGQRKAFDAVGVVEQFGAWLWLPVRSDPTSSLTSWVIMNISEQRSRAIVGYPDPTSGPH